VPDLTDTINAESNALLLPGFKEITVIEGLAVSDTEKLNLFRQVIYKMEMEIAALKQELELVKSLVEVINTKPPH
jgi:hypothetical protein